MTLQIPISHSMGIKLILIMVCVIADSLFYSVTSVTQISGWFIAFILMSGVSNFLIFLLFNIMEEWVKFTDDKITAQLSEKSE